MFNSLMIYQLKTN